MPRIFSIMLMCCTGITQFLSAQQQRLPNIILIVADDLGYGDVSFGRTEGRVTPQLDKLAMEGMRLTDFHSNGPVCSPTRAALMTGRYQQRSHIESALGPDDKGLPNSEITIAEYLKAIGYATAVFGKWHLGTIPEANPVRNGFDEFRGHLNSVDYHSHIGPWGNPDWWVNDKLQNEEGYNSDLIAAHATRFIREHKTGPFFLYVPFSNIHFPWCTPDDPEFWVEGGNYYESIDTKLGPHSPNEDVTPIIQRMIEELDKSVGSIVNEVKKTGLQDNTFIFFMSDNGGYIDYRGRHQNQISNNGPLRGQKSDLYEGGTRVPAIAWWPGKIKPGSQSDELAVSMDLLPTILKLTAHDLNAIEERHAIDGSPMQDILFQRQVTNDRMVFWRIRNKCAVREGTWKLVFTKTSNNEFELFNLAEDIGEKNNLASVHAAKVSRLKDAFFTWEKDVETNSEPVKKILKK